MTRGALDVIPTFGLSLVLALVLAMAANPVTLVSAATSGPLMADSGANANGPGSIAWTNPGFIVADDLNYATAVLTPSATSEYLQGTNYGFNIPLDATIDGIAVSIMRQSSGNMYGNSIDDSDVYLLKAGVIAGTDHAVTTDWPVTMTLATYGGTADLWGSTWTPAEINAAGFGVALSARNESPYGDRTAYVDYMQITITYVFGTTTTVATSGSPSTYGDSVAFTATVTGSGGTNTPSGVVDFQDGGVSIGTGTLSDIGGGAAEATIVTSSLDADNHDITAVYNGDSNFSGSTSSPTTQVVSQRNITVMADAHSKAYGDSDPVLTYQITSGSLAGGDSFTGALRRATGEALGTYAIEQETLTLSSNYNLTYVGANLSITVRPITVTADAQTKAYGDADPALTYTFSPTPLPFGDTFSGALSRTAGEIVGSYAISQGTLSLNSSYSLTYVGANLTVTPRAVTVAADAQSKVYGANDPTLTYQITSGSLVGEDSFTGALTRAAGDLAGTYDIQQGTLALSSSYTLTYVGASLTITARSLVILPPAPILNRVGPESGHVGQRLDVVIYGSEFVGATAVAFGPGVTVNSFVALSLDRIRANVTIDPGASLGPRDVTVTTPSGDGALEDAFSISKDSSGGSGSWWFWILGPLLALALGLLLFILYRRRKKKEPEQPEAAGTTASQS